MNQPFAASAGGEEERIAGQKGRHDQARFAENDHEQEEISDRVESLDDFLQMHIQVQEDVDQGL